MRAARPIIDDLARILTGQPWSSQNLPIDPVWLVSTVAGAALVALVTQPLFGSPRAVLRDEAEFVRTKTHLVRLARQLLGMTAAEA